MQTPQDRSDPSVVEQELRLREERRRDAPAPKLDVDVDDPEAALTRPVLIRAVRLEGATALPASAYAPVILPYKGRTLSGTELQDLATAIAEVARAAGYGLASAWVPEQTVDDGLLRVTIDEGRIDDVRVDGDASAAVLPLFDGIAAGRPVRTAELERRLLLADDLPGVEIEKPRLERIEERTVLVLGTSYDPIRGRAYLDNWGSSTVGPVRAHLSIDLNGLFAGSDRLTVGGVVTPLSPKEFALARIGYSKIVGRNGTELIASAYAARSSPGGELADREFEGRSVEGAIGISHPVLRSRAASAWVEAEFAVRDAEQSLAGVVVRDDRLAVAKLGFVSSADLAGGTMRVRVAGSRGLDVLDATHRGDPMASRADGSAIFSKLEFWGHIDGPLFGPLSFQLQSEGQIASRPLLSSEEMGLGGRYFLRGYDYREFSGDKGVAGSVELRFDLPQWGKLLRAAQLYGYADAGTVGNYRGGGGGGSLASAGGGVRTWLARNLDASLEVGVPLKEGANPDESLNPRISFVIGSRFE